MKRVILGLAAVLFAGTVAATGNNNQNGPQGGDATAIAGANASSKVENYNDVRNTNINANTNVNSNKQGQVQGQKQGQVQGQGQSQSTKNSNNAKQSTDVTFTSPRSPAAAMPGAANTTASCRNGISAGVGGFLPIGGGITVLDTRCDKRESARARLELAKIAHSMGFHAEAIVLLNEAYALLDAADKDGEVVVPATERDDAFASFVQ